MHFEIGAWIWSFLHTTALMFVSSWQSRVYWSKCIAAVTLKSKLWNNRAHYRVIFRVTSQNSGAAWKYCESIHSWAEGSWLKREPQVWGPLWSIEWPQWTWGPLSVHAQLYSIQRIRDVFAEQTAHRVRF